MNLQRLSGAIEENGRHTSGAALQGLSQMVAAELRSSNPASARVAVVCEDQAQFVATVHGVIAAGQVAVPLSARAPIDGSLGADVLAARLDHAEAAFVFADAAHQPVLEKMGYRRSGRVFDDELIVWTRTNHEPAASHADGTALIVYTSGSSGAPKGAMLSIDALARIGEVNADLYGWRSGDRFLAALPLTHVAGLTNMFSALQAGVDVLVAPPITFVEAVLDAIEDGEVTVAGVVPYQLGRLFKADRAPVLRKLRLIVTSAAPLSKAIIESVRRHAPSLDLRNAYGLTEAFRSFVTQVGDGGDDPSTIGSALPDVGVQLRDPETGTLVPVGVEGEIWLNGPHLFSGYWKPQRTVAKITDGWFQTGDLAVADEHDNYRLTGRLHNVVNVAGQKTPIETIEAIIDAAAPGAIAAVAIQGDQGSDQVIAVADAATSLSLIGIRRICAKRLPPSLGPRRLILIDSLPRTLAGKIDRPALQDLVSSTLRTKQ